MSDIITNKTSKTITKYIDHGDYQLGMKLDRKTKKLSIFKYFNGEQQERVTLTEVETNELKLLLNL